ncbi:MAG TPA: RNA polymerase sigma factor [Polyangia bacterium]|nr:RNA polymerase sigma factor [Polyangia bacterium]
MPPNDLRRLGGQPRELIDIYERELRYVWQGLRRLGIPPRDLPDVTHDVFITVFLNLHKYDRARPLRPWLFGVMFRVASDHLSLGRNKREVLEVAPEPVSSAPPSDVTVQTRQEWMILDQALRTLDVGRRAVLIMHDFDGSTGQQIADTLGIPLTSVFNRLRSARRAVQDLAAQLASDPPESKRAAGQRHQTRGVTSPPATAAATACAT